MKNKTLRQWRKKKLQQILNDPTAFDSILREAVALLVAKEGGLK